MLFKPLNQTVPKFSTMYHNSSQMNANFLSHFLCFPYTLPNIIGHMWDFFFYFFYFGYFLKKKTKEYIVNCNEYNIKWNTKSITDYLHYPPPKKKNTSLILFGFSCHPRVISIFIEIIIQDSIFESEDIHQVTTSLQHSS